MQICFCCVQFRSKTEVLDSPKGNKNEKVNLTTIFTHISYNHEIHLCKSNDIGRQKTSRLQFKY